jgi:Terminase large subunit, T4likevirus-type, N-terminal/Terminase RNaseH-like domain
MVDLSRLKGYNGNSNLKRSRQSIEWTPELIGEYVKCSDDPIYFIETYMKIININDGLVSFKLYDYQKEMVLAMKENRFNIIATARQAGKSTVTCGFILWYIIFHSDKTVALLANKGETAREILGRVQLAYEHLPRWLQHGVVEWNKGSFELENNSRVIAAATSKSGIRGYSINLLFIDEAAFIENWDDFFTSVYPTISSGKESKVILVSTPNGLNHFYSLWINAREQRNGYKPIQVMWDAVPGRDEQWRQDTLASMNFDTEKFDQEYCVEFMGSSGTLIAGWKLKELVHQVPIVLKQGLSQYVLPEKGHSYVIMADVSRGKGLDYSAFHIIDVTKMPYNQVCVYRNNSITPLDYAAIIHKMAMAYNQASVMVEINDIGEQVGQSLHFDYEYEGVLLTESAGRAGKRVTLRSSGPSVDWGIRTTKNVKAAGCSIIKLLIEQNQLIINDFHTIEELATFSRKLNSYEAEEGKHDDLVMGLVLFGWLSDQQYFREYTDINTLQRLREKSEEEIMDDMLPFGFIDDGRDDVIEQLELPRGNWLVSDIENEFL